MSSRRTNQFPRKKEVSNDEPICYECKGQGHYAKECDNKKKLKTHKKGMATTWDNGSDESESESQSSDDDRIQGVKAFITWSTPMISLANSVELESYSESEFEEVDDGDIQEAFDKLFLESVKLEKENIKLKKENKELTSMSISLEHSISELQITSSSNFNCESSELLMREKGEMREKINEPESKLKDSRILPT